MKIRLFAAISLMWMSLSTVSAQMTFTLNGVTYSDVAERNSKGFTTVTLPAGTDLSGLITAVAVDGSPIDASLVTPNPTTTKLNYDELKVFTYDNKAYASWRTSGSARCSSPTAISIRAAGMTVQVLPT